MSGTMFEPFAGALGCLLNRPHEPGIETINDLDGFVCNAWRSIAQQPEATVAWADNPINECDLHARHIWLKARRETLTAQLMADPDYCDPKIAGWWLWGICCWIGGGWCGEGRTGPWVVEGGELVRRDSGRGVRRKLPHLGSAGQGVHCPGADLLPWFYALQARLRRVRVCCGDWQRVMGESVTFGHGLTGILLDPPYSTEEGRDMNIYALDSGTVAHDVRDWCLANGDNPLLRIVLCGYGTVHDELVQAGWTRTEWKTNGGMGNQGQGRGRENASREVLWCSPHCLRDTQLSMF